MNLIIINGNIDSDIQKHTQKNDITINQGI